MQYLLEREQFEGWPSGAHSSQQLDLRPLLAVTAFVGHCLQRAVAWEAWCRPQSSAGFLLMCAQQSSMLLPGLCQVCAKRSSVAVSVGQALLCRTVRYPGIGLCLHGPPLSPSPRSPSLETFVMHLGGSVPTVVLLVDGQLACCSLPPQGCSGNTGFSQKLLPLRLLMFAGGSRVF